MFITLLIKITQDLHNDVEQLKKENEFLKQNNSKLVQKINEIDELKTEVE